MQCDFVFAYLRLSRDDKEKMEESNSIKNQRLLIQHFVENQPEFAGAKLKESQSDFEYSETPISEKAI